MMSVVSSTEPTMYHTDSQGRRYRHPERHRRRQRVPRRPALRLQTDQHHAKNKFGSNRNVASRYAERPLTGLPRRRQPGQRLLAILTDPQAVAPSRRVSSSLTDSLEVVASSTALDKGRLLPELLAN